jgi:hypothetical protein
MQDHEILEYCHYFSKEKCIDLQSSFFACKGSKIDAIPSLSLSLFISEQIECIKSSNFVRADKNMFALST